jgi:hypothetical protein
LPLEEPIKPVFSTPPALACIGESWSGLSFESHELHVPQSSYGHSLGLQMLRLLPKCAITNPLSHRPLAGTAIRR